MVYLSIKINKYVMIIYEIMSKDNEPVRIKLRGFTRSSDSLAAKWVNKVYATLPKNPLNSDQVAMMFGSDADQQIALFELEPSNIDDTTVYIKWFQTHPQKQGVGSKAILKLQNMAKEAGLKLALTSWKHGKVPERVLNRFYKNLGFEPNKSGVLVWDPSVSESWSKKYKKSINCSNPKGFSQRAHCAARKKRQAGGKTKSKSINEASWSKYDPSTYDDEDFVSYQKSNKNIIPTHTRSKPKSKKIDRTDDNIREKSITTVIENFGTFVFTGHFRDRLRQRNIPERKAIEFIGKMFIKHGEYLKSKKTPFKFLLKDKDGLGIIVEKTGIVNSLPIYTVITAHPHYSEASDAKELSENNLLNKPTPSIDELAKKYSVTVHQVLKELEKGIKVEKEHTDLLHVAREIALDHLGEDLYYYVKLAKAENSSGITEEKYKDTIDTVIKNVKDLFADKEIAEALEYIIDSGWTVNDSPDLNAIVDDNIGQLAKYLVQELVVGDGEAEFLALDRAKVKAIGITIPNEQITKHLKASEQQLIRVIKNMIRRNNLWRAIEAMSELAELGINIRLTDLVDLKNTNIKNMIIKNLLINIKSSLQVNLSFSVGSLIKMLRSNGIDWVELDIIERSLKADKLITGSNNG